MMEWLFVTYGQTPPLLTAGILLLVVASYGYAWLRWRSISSMFHAAGWLFLSLFYIFIYLDPEWYVVYIRFGHIRMALAFLAAINITHNLYRLLRAIPIAKSVENG